MKLGVFRPYMAAGSILEVKTESAEETQSLGRAIGEMAEGGDIFLLIGELGSGKTCLVQGIAQGLGIKEVVSSPSFVFIKEYFGRLPLYHIDLYRVDDPREIALLGLSDYLYGEGVVVIEWAEKIKELWTPEYLLIRIEYIEEDSRLFRFFAQGKRYARFSALKWSWL